MRLETERLVLREMTMDDFAALKAVLSDAENMKYYPSAYDDAKVRRWIEWCQSSYAENGFGLWAAVLKESGQMIGDCGISMQRINWQTLPEIGYHILRAYHRRGYASEAARACIRAGFEVFHFPALNSYMTSANEPSYRTAMKNGMRFVEEYISPEGEALKVYRVTREEWEMAENAR